MLFKILHGDDANISTDITPFHEGWCYLTHSGALYADVNIGTKESPNNQRIQINESFTKNLLNITNDIGCLDGGVITEGVDSNA